MPISHSASPTAKEGYLTVSELNHLLTVTLEAQLPMLRVQGEISEVTLAKSGHLYFRLKDSDAQIESVMWRGSATALRFRPEKGMVVLCEGRPSVYKASGRLQIVVHRMSEAGEGALQRAFLLLKEKLEKEGLFAPERKRPLPFFPKAIGVVTSRQGAVIHDIMVRIRERMPQVKVYLVDVRVQGEGAASQIADGIRLLNEFGNIDAMIVGRGGGSLEDLWAFNEEEVVRAIFGSRIPIISSVGHESDVTLADLVADVRAPTPTAAAEMIVPKRQDLLTRLRELSDRLRSTDRWFLQFEQQLDDREARLVSQSGAVLARLRLSVRGAENQLKLLEPKRVLEVRREKLSRCASSLEKRAFLSSKEFSHRVTVLATQLEALSPFRVLERGYAVVQRGGMVIRSSAALKVGENISVTFASGLVEAQITANKQPKDKTS